MPTVFVLISLLAAFSATSFAEEPSAIEPGCYCFCQTSPAPDSKRLCSASPRDADGKAKFYCPMGLELFKFDVDTTATDEATLNRLCESLAYPENRKKTSRCAGVARRSDDDKQEITWESVAEGYPDLCFWHARGE